MSNSHKKHLPHEPVNAAGRNVVGIDIGRATHAAAGVRATGDLAGPKIAFTSDRAGIDRLEKMLLAPLGGPADVLVAMEATGHYWMPVASELMRRGYECAVINPIQTRAKFRTRIRTIAKEASRGKIDARLANEIVNRASCSIGIRAGEQVLVEQLRGTIDLMQAAEKQRDELDAVLKQRVADLDSPLTHLGLSAPIVATIHGESDPVSDFPHAWQYAAFAGVEPSTFASGDYVRTSDTPISKRGSSYLRHALHLGAVSVYRKHTFFKRCYERHRSHGRHHTDALVIVTHKLARVTWRLLTDNRRFTARPPKHQPDAGAIMPGEVPFFTVSERAEAAEPGTCANRNRRSAPSFHSPYPAVLCVLRDLCSEIPRCRTNVPSV